ncbi:YdaS family helix-turn-helix protein [Thiobacillus denitrificans]|uniref:transcriptional regulator n=1 Tax=Thiobacillus denitrificans TaxID=36861 RepID=UPI0009E837E6
MIDALQHAISLADGQSSLARKLTEHFTELGESRKVTQANVWSWLNSKNPDHMPPSDFCPGIEKITGVPCERMRPDIEWAVLRGVPCKCETADALPPGAAVAGDRRAEANRRPDLDFCGFGEQRESARRQDDRRGEGAAAQVEKAA